MLTAKEIVDGKIWILEDSGKKFATIQIGPNGTVVLIDNERKKTRFDNVGLLIKAYNITFDKNKAIIIPKPHKKETIIYGFPTDSEPFNSLFDVKNQVPIYTRSANSEEYFCAGYYVIRIITKFSPKVKYTTEFCPRFVKINRTEFDGPYATDAEATKQLLSRLSK